MQKCVIVGAGVCDVQKLKERVILNDADLCIAADGGLHYLLKSDITPDIILGDMDSVQTGELPAKVRIKKLPVEKDDTDMLAAIKEGLAAGYKRFELYGALGGRFDHTFANIQCLLYLLNHGARGIIAGDDVTLMLIRDENIIFKAEEAEQGKRISVFAFGGDAYGVSEKGLKYLLDHVTIKQEFPIGVSNEFVGKDARIEVQEGMLLICVDEKVS